MTEKQINKIEKWLEERRINNNPLAERVLEIISGKQQHHKDALLKKFIHPRQLQMILNEKESNNE